VPKKWIGKSRDKLMRLLVFSAKERCECGAGLAYNKRASHPVWDCSAILLGDALLEAGERGVSNHRMPCSYYEVISERNRAAGGETTRPAAA
jgi:hypothetical protein